MSVVSESVEFTLIIPTYNAGVLFKDVIKSIQNVYPQPKKIVVIDSSSVDGTAEMVVEAGFELQVVTQESFDHGGTRNNALSFVETEFVVYMTQDVILQTKDALELLLSSFNDSHVAAAFGRQLPHTNSTALSAFARRQNYPSNSYITHISSEYPQGIRKAFMSNSFAAYRLSALKEIGGFPEKLILGEDAFAAGKMLLAQYKIAYVSEASVRHSHNYSLKEEFKRYFDIGVFHTDQRWLLDTFGAPEKTGFVFAFAQIAYLIEKNKHYLIPYSVFSLAIKYLGYRLGRRYEVLPKKWCAFCSMHSKYWTSKKSEDKY